MFKLQKKSQQYKINKKTGFLFFFIKETPIVKSLKKEEIFIYGSVASLI